MVNRPALEIPARFHEQLEQAELIAAMGHTPRVEVVAHERREVTPEEAEEFRVPAGTAALTTTKVWYADEVPVMLATDTVPLPRGAAPPDGIDPAMSLFDLVELGAASGWSGRSPGRARTRSTRSAPGCCAVPWASPRSRCASPAWPETARSRTGRPRRTCATRSATPWSARSAAGSGRPVRHRAADARRAHHPPDHRPAP